MSRFILIPALIILVVALGLALHWRGQRDDARAQVDRLQTNIRVMEEKADQAARAYRELEANLATARARAAEYDALEQAILEGEDDVDLPPWFPAYVDALVDRLFRTGQLAPRDGDDSE